MCSGGRLDSDPAYMGKEGKIKGHSGLETGRMVVKETGKVDLTGKI